jgi:poly-gamma-glutamate capsule biosynthesis protein CapA/YwtB (metallophosphatase superfamily)
MINRLDRRNFLKAAGLAAAGATAGMAFANPVEAFAAATGKVRLMATGQALIENDLRQYAYAGYAAVAAYLKKADVRMCNLNVAIADPHADTKAAPHAGAPTRKDKFFHAADPQVLGCLKDMGFNLLALAANHAWDLGSDGLIATRAAVERAGFACAGTGADRDAAAMPAYLGAKDGQMALVSMATGKLADDAVASANAPGVNGLAVEKGMFDRVDAHRNLRAIQAAASVGAAVIVSHNNHDWDDDLQAVPDWQRRWAQECIDAGASIYIGTGATMLHGIEIYQGRPILYGLGNFIFHTHTEPEFYPPSAWESVIADCRFEGQKCREIRLQPITLNEWGEEGSLNQATRGRPTLADSEDSVAILEGLAQISKEFGTAIRVEGGQGVISFK